MGAEPGYLGPAVAMLVSNYLGSLMFYFATRSLLRATASQLIPVASITRALIASLLAVLPGSLIETTLGLGLASLAAEGVSFGLAYFAAGYFLRVFMPNDLAKLRSWAQRLSPLPRRRSGP